MPIRYRKRPNAPVDTMPRSARALEPLWVRSVTNFAPAAMPTASSTTIVECPRANQKPTETGRLSSAMSFRVVLSIAAM